MNTKEHNWVRILGGLECSECGAFRAVKQVIYEDYIGECKRGVRSPLGIGYVGTEKDVSTKNQTQQNP